MKTKIVLSTAAVAVAATFLLIDRPFAATEASSPGKPAVTFPVDTDCVLTVEYQAWMGSSPSVAPGTPSGFRPDFTMQGKLVYLGADWVVLKDGTYENWISRDKVLSIRASR